MMGKQYQIFNDCCPVCGMVNCTIQFVWTTLPEDRTHAHRKGHEVMIMKCQCGMITTVERIPMITTITKFEDSIRAGDFDADST